MSHARHSPVNCAPSDLEVSRLEKQVRGSVGNRVRNLRIRWQKDGWLLEGKATSYHAKQLVQEAIMETTPLPIQVNRIEVTARP